MLFVGLQWLFFMFANTVVIPITIGAAFDLSSMEVVSLFVAYLQLFSGALSNLKGIQFTSNIIDRIAAPVLLGIAIMNIPAPMFESLSIVVRLLLSSGLLVGIILAIVLENLIKWDKTNNRDTN